VQALVDHLDLQGGRPVGVQLPKQPLGGQAEVARLARECEDLLGRHLDGGGDRPGGQPLVQAELHPGEVGRDLALAQQRHRGQQPLQNCDSPSLMMASRPMRMASPASPTVTNTGLVRIDRPRGRGRRAMRLHLVTTVDGLPIAFALAPKTDEREVLVDLFDVEPGLLAGRERVVILVDTGYCDAQTEASLAERGVTLVRPAYRGEAPRPGQGLFRPLRQRICRSTRRSRASLTWNATAAARSRASPRGC
jgi:hypothetical protein